MASGKKATVAPVVAASPEPATGSAETPPDAAISPAASGETLTPPDSSPQVLTPESAAQVIDLHGPSDPLAHLTRPAGRRGRPLGRKDSPTTARQSGKTLRINPDPDAPAGRAVVDARVDYKATAEWTVGTVTGLFEGVIGPEWKPSDPERVALNNATEQYFRAKGIPDIPPGWMLFIVVMGYATPRLNSPSTKAKLAQWLGKTKSALKQQ